MLTSLFLGVSKFSYASGESVWENYKAPLKTDFKIINVNVPQLIFKNGECIYVKVDKVVRNIHVDDIVNKYNAFIQTGKRTALGGVKYNIPIKAFIQVGYPDEISVIFPLDHLNKQSYLEVYFKKIDGTDTIETQAYNIRPWYLFSINHGEK